MAGRFIFDASATLALGAGSPSLSQLVHEAALSDDLRLFVPAASLLEADTLRTGVAEHVGMLDVLDVVALDFAAVAWCGARVLAGATAGVAHAAYLAQPSVDWPDGRPVITRDPGDYKGMAGVRTIPLR